MPESDKGIERIKTWWRKSKSTIAHNKVDICQEIKQPRGVISLSKEGVASCAIEEGIDEPLGCWAWETLRGKNNILTTIILGYRPCRNLKDENSMYNQQLRYLAAKQIEVCPRQLWLDNLERLIKNKQKKLRYYNTLLSLLI